MASLVGYFEDFTSTLRWKEISVKLWTREEGYKSHLERVQPQARAARKRC